MNSDMWKYIGKDLPDFADKPDEGQESVWQYPRPPALVPDARLVEIKHDDLLIASTRNSQRLCETASPPTFYLPTDDVNFDLLVPVKGGSICEWKGQARYWSVKTDPKRAMAWSYANPHAKYAALANHLAFYPALLACFVDGERVRPQPGQFYGGWITDDVVGPFKGEPGTGHW